MIEWVKPQPTTEPALLALGIGFLAFLVALLAINLRRGSGDADATQQRSAASRFGVLIQMFGFAAVGFGPLMLAVDPSRARLLQGTMLIVLLDLFALGLFFAAIRAMGRNWAIVARTREDHELVTSGPFALIRNPIYIALFAWLVAMAIAFGHFRGLIPGVPLYWIGTWIRVREEEKLLRIQFGAAYDAYTARVKRFVPGLI